MANIPQWKVGDVLSASKLNAMVDAINDLLADQTGNNDVYVTLNELNDILKQYSDIGHTHSVEEIANLVLPTKLSQLQNDTSYATEDYVTNAIANAQLGGDGEVDLSAYATKNYVDAEIEKIELIPGPKGEKGEQGPKGDDGYTPIKGVDYFTTADKEAMLSGYATESFVSESIANAQLGGDGEVDLSAYATKEYVDDYTGGKKQRYITQAEYDALPDADKNDQTIVWNIVDAIDYNENNIPTDLSLDNNTLYLIDSNGNNIGDGVILNISNDNDDSQEPAELDVPRVYFYGDALPTTKDNVKLEMDYKSNTMKFHSYVKLKCQGTSSMNYAKKNFTLTLYEDSDRSVDLKKNFKGWGAQNKFCLKANWVDSTHTRNLSGARIAYDMVESRPDSPFKQELLKCPRNGAVDGFPIKVYFNGEFWGIYTWNIPKDAWMFNMNEDNPNHIVLCAERNTDGNSAAINSCQFRKLWDGVDKGDWSYEVGTPSDAVKVSLNRCISFVMNATDQEFHDNISDYFDLYSLLDYYCFAYVACHLDGLAKNMLLATYDGVVWGACLYDMDSIYGVYWNGSSFVSPEYKCPEQYQEQFSRLWVRIEECFADELRARYAELRQHALSLTNIVGHVEEIYDLLSPNMKTDEITKWPSIPTYNTNTITRFRNYMRDRVKYTDAEIALISSFIACESITLSKTELKMGIFNGGDGSAPEDDSNVNYIADAQWEVGSIVSGTGEIDPNNKGDRYCIIENLPIGLYTLHHDTFTYKKICIRAYDDVMERQAILIDSNYAGGNITDDITFRISCPDTKVYIGIFPNGSEDYSGVTLKRQDLPTPIKQDLLYSISSITQPGWSNMGDTVNNLLLEIKVGSTTEIPDVTDIRTLSIGNDVYYAAWSVSGVDNGSFVEKYQSKCLTNTAYAGYWYLLVSLPTAKFGKTLDEFKSYCSDNGIEWLVINSSNSESSAVTTPIETTWEKGYLARNAGAINSGNAGTVMVADADSTTDFIAVQPGDTIHVSTNLTIGKSFGCVGYDSDKKFAFVYNIDNAGLGTWITTGIMADYNNTSLTVTNIPENVAYVRICVALALNNVDDTITSFTISRTDQSGGTKLLKYTLKATVLPTNSTDEVIWSVEPKGICTVVNGCVTAINNGDCVVTATCGEHSATCNVNVSGIEASEPTLPEGVLFELSDTLVGDGTESTPYIDTGIALFDSDNVNNNWTILLECVGNVGSNNVVAHCMMETGGYPGVSIDYTGNGLRLVLPNNRPINVIQNVLGIRTCVAIVKDGNSFTVYDKFGNVKDTAEVIPVGHNSTLVIGAYKTAVGQYGRYLNGKINNLRVSSRAYTREEVVNYFKETTSTIPIGVLAYELNEPQVLDGTSKYVDTRIPLCEEDIDYTIFMNFKFNTPVDSHQTILHCMTETQPYPGISFRVESTNNPALSGACVSPVITTTPDNKALLNSQTTEVQSFVVRRQGSTIQVTSKNGTGSATYTYYGTTKYLLLGAFQDIDGVPGRFANITVNQAKVWTKALTDEEIQALIELPIEIPQEELVLFTSSAGITNESANKDIWQDLSGNGNNLALKNFSFNDSSGWVNGGLKCNGTTNYLALVDENNFNLDTSKDVTIMLMIKGTTFTSSQSRCFIQTNMWSSGIHMSYYKSGELQLKIGSGSVIKKAVELDSTGQNIVNLCIVKSNGNNRLYYNNELANTDTSSFTFNKGKLRIMAGDGDSIGDYADGTIYSVAIYNRALTESEMTAVYNYQMSLIQNSEPEEPLEPASYTNYIYNEDTFTNPAQGTVPSASTYYYTS